MGLLIIFGTIWDNLFKTSAGFSWFQPLPPSVSSYLLQSVGKFDVFYGWSLLRFNYIKCPLLKLHNCSNFKQQFSRMQQYNTTNYQKWFPQNQQNYFCHNKPEKMSIWEMQGHIQFLESIETFWIVILLNAKGQLISKCLFGAIVSTKKPMKFFKNFCPSL